MKEMAVILLWWENPEFLSYMVQSNQEIASKKAEREHRWH